MALQIEDYAIIGDCKTVALVGSDGSIDWLCWPRFDSAACFAALLGTSDNGRWAIAPTVAPRGVKRRYRPGTLILETEFQTETGSATIVDFMPPADGADLVRIVIGQSGSVDFRTEFVGRFDYGATIPWVRRLYDGAISAVAGPERLVLRGPVALKGEDLKTVGDFTVGEDQSAAFVLSYGASFENPPSAIDPFESLERTETFWREWSDQGLLGRHPRRRRLLSNQVPGRERHGWTLADKGIRINAVCPGMIDTPMMVEVSKNYDPDIVKAMVLRSGRAAPCVEDPPLL